MSAVDGALRPSSAPLRSSRLPRRPTTCASTCAGTRSSSCSRSSSTCTPSRTPSSCRPTHLDDLLDRGRRVRGLRGRRHRPAAERPGHDRDARRALAHAAAVAPGGRALRLRRAGRGRGVAVLPAHDPAPPARPRPGARLRVQDRLRARVLPRAPARGRRDRARRPARHARPALLRHARADAQPRLRGRRRAPPRRRSAGTTTRPTTRTPTASSSRTSPTRTR